MPERSALITLLILERPLCMDCIAVRSALPVTFVQDYLGRIHASLTVYHEENDRCRACGTVTKVYSVSRLPPS
jgi:formamidopyrimidine-DNA glycosylase